MTYFLLLYKLGGRERFLIWMSNDTDSVAVSHEGLVQSFSSLATLRRFADANGWPIEPEQPMLHDLDVIANWILAKNAPVDCRESLSAWNLFRDVANSLSTPKKTSFETLDSQLDSVYDKLFRGNNLPAVTPEGENFVPIWSQQEVSSLAALLSAGLELFKSSIKLEP